MHAGIEQFFKLDLSFYVTESPEAIQFRSFCNENRHLLFPIVGIEQRIVDIRYRLAGTIDLISADLQNEGLILIDWKRTAKNLTKGKHTSDQTRNYWYQLNLYRDILERNYDVCVSGMYIVQIHPELDNYRLHKVETLDCSHLILKQRSQVARKRWKSAFYSVLFIQELELMYIMTASEKQLIRMHLGTHDEARKKALVLAAKISVVATIFAGALLITKKWARH